MIKVRLAPAPAPRPFPMDLDATARWALDQAVNNWPHCISRLDVLARAATLALQQAMPALFVDGNGARYEPAEVLAILGRGEDPRPVYE